MALVGATLGAVPAHSSPSVAPSARLAHRSNWPAPITHVKARPGRRAGETRISWRSSGARTAYFRIQTALTPFGRNRPGMPTVGWKAHAFKVGGNRRSITLTPRQVARAGAPLGSGRHLLFRVSAVGTGSRAAHVRHFAHIRAATIAGEAPRMRGAAIRVASYNVRLASLDIGSQHAWSNRAPLVARNLARQHPTVAALQELVPAMWTHKAGGPGLHHSLKALGLGRYRLTRSTPYSSRIIGDARILYDATRLHQVDRCRAARMTCGIVFSDAGHRSVAPYAKFRDRASGMKFWFVSTHLTHGRAAHFDALRAREVKSILHGIHRINTQRLPVILGGDLNSYQTCPGHNLPHQRLLDAGFYDTSAAAHQINLQYNSHNGFATPERPSPNGFGARLDVVMTTGMPGASRFKVVRTGAPYPSDHNLVYADLRLPAA
jgi:endonuclease/exonuclease/phosphatase family metal-dependent hydrolase